jgi:predicted Fe-Mo cluster-binding NifX family protein
MKIAIASEGINEDARISKQSGRAPYFIIVENNKIIDVLENPFVSGGGVARNVSQMLADENIDLFIAGNFGPNMEMFLKTYNIKMKKATGYVKDFL